MVFPAVAAAIAALALGGAPAAAGGYAVHVEAMDSARAATATVLVQRRARPGAAAAAVAMTAAAARRDIKEKAVPPNDRLFGTQETVSDNFGPFKKWTSAVEKMTVETQNLEAFKARFKPWLGYLASLKDKDPETQIKEVNEFMNRAEYIQDDVNWGISDYWASPGEFISKFGDCEDYSIAKYMALKYLGFETDKLRIVAVKDMNLNIGHAILAVYLEDRIMILDNQIKIVVDSRKVRHYQPVYSINEQNWWRHRAAGSG